MENKEINVVDIPPTTTENVETKSIDVPSIPETVQKEEHIVTPAKTLWKMHSVRLGKIFSNISIVCIVFLVLSALLPIIGALGYMVYYTFLIVLPIFTLGLVFVPETFGWYSSLWYRGGFVDGISSFSEGLFNSWPWIGAVSVAAAVLSIVFLCMDRKNLSVGRIVVSSIILACTIVIITLLAIGGK